MRSMRGCLGSLIVVMLAATDAAPKPVVVECTTRFDVNGGGNPAGEFGIVPKTLELDGDALELDGWCRLEGLKRKPMKYGQTRLKRRFRECGSLPAGRFVATLERECGAIRATVKIKKVRRTLALYAVKHIPASTFHTIEDRILSDRGCAVSTCHGDQRAGNLDLRPGTAFDSLVGVDPDNAAARGKGMKLVAPGDVAASFLSAKVHGTLGPEEGDAMPPQDDRLPEIEVALIDAWIAAGAPETGEVEGAPELPPRIYTETPPLAPPANGFQLVLDGPVLQPGEEEEGCLWVPSPPADVAMQKVEIALNPGTHHFAVWQHSGSTPPPLGTWLANDIACLNTGGNLGQNLTGAPHAPYFVAEQPPGFAVQLPGDTYYGLNAHYYNESSQPIQVKVWVNVYPYEGTPEHLVRFLPFELAASGNINVPPYTQKTVQGRFTNTSAKTMHVTGVGGHMHKRGVRFSIWTSDGTKVHDDFDWAHPSFRDFDPPHALAPGDWIDFECLHDNGVNRPVRLDYGGRPMTIAFGVSAEDEMCILTGQYFDD